ncbi:MAG: hypothetical protein V4683_19130 [Bacteroidota bacterium]
MTDFKKAIDYLKTRSIETKKENFSLIKTQVQVVSISTVITVLEMIEDKSFDKFLANIEEWGFPIK